MRYENSKKTTSPKRTLLVIILLLGTSPVGAVPMGFNVQGRVTDKNGVNRTDGQYSIEFAIHGELDADSLLWKKTYNSTTSPKLNLRNGNFQVNLADPADAGSPNASLAQVFAQDDTLYLQITVLGGPGLTAAEPPMKPRQQLISVPFAIRALEAENSFIDTTRGVKTTVSLDGSFRVKAEAISVGGVRFTDVDITKTGISPTPNNWYSINIVTNEEKQAPELCVVIGALDAPSSCGGQVSFTPTKSRRIGWASTHPTEDRPAGAFIPVEQIGDWWYYDAILAVREPLESGRTTTVPIDGRKFLPPSSTLSTCMAYAGRTSGEHWTPHVNTQAGVPGNLTGARIYQIGSSSPGNPSWDNSIGALQTDSNQQFVVMGRAHFSGIQIHGYYDPIR